MNQILKELSSFKDMIIRSSESYRSEKHPNEIYGTFLDELWIKFGILEATIGKLLDE